MGSSARCSLRDAGCATGSGRFGAGAAYRIQRLGFRQQIDAEAAEARRERGELLSGSNCAAPRIAPRHPQPKKETWGRHPRLSCPKTCLSPPALFRGLRVSLLQSPEQLKLRREPFAHPAPAHRAQRVAQHH
jgi:hypothetical protein